MVKSRDRLRGSGGIDESRKGRGPVLADQPSNPYDAHMTEHQSSSSHSPPSSASTGQGKFLLIEDPDFEGSPRSQEWPRILEWFETERHSRIKPRGFAIIKGATTNNDLYRQIWEDSTL